MLSYYRTMEWHEKHDNEDTTSASGRVLFYLKTTINMPYCWAKEKEKG